MYQNNELVNSNEMETLRSLRLHKNLRDAPPITFIIKLIFLFLKKKLKVCLNHFLLSEVWSVADCIFEELS